MRWGDERAVTVQIGAVLLLAILFIALALYQVNAVPAENEAIEIAHNEEVQSELVDVRNTLRNTDHGSRSVSVTLGTQYETRTFAVNPPSPIGTVETITPEAGITVENADVDDTRINSLLEEELETSLLRYEPQYNEYESAPETILEHSLLYNEFGHTNVTLEDQRLVHNNKITLVVVDGDFSRTDVGTVSIDIDTLGGPGTATLKRENEGDNATITIPTESPERWTNSIGETFGDGELYAKIEHEQDDRVTIEFYGDQTYNLQVAKVSVGDGGEPDDRYDGVVPTPGQGSDSVRGPLVFNANAPEEVVSGTEFTLDATARSIGSETTTRSGTPITGGKWESAGPDETREGEMDVNGDPDNLDGVKLEDQITDQIDTDGWETGEHTFTVWGQDASGRLTNDSEVDEMTIEIKEEIEGESFFGVTIDNADSPVAEGEAIEVEATVENIGDEIDTQTVELFDFDGNVVDEQEVELEGGSSTEETLIWETEQGDAGTGDIIVESKDDSDSEEVTITEQTEQMADAVEAIEDSTHIQGNDRPQFDFQISESVELDAAAIETRNELSEVGADTPGGGAVFTIAGEESDVATTTDGSFDYGFDSHLIEDIEGDVEVDFDRLDTQIQNLEFTNDEENADLVISLRFTDNSVKQFYFNAEER